MKKFLLFGLFMAFGYSVFAQIAIQDFGAGNTWSYAPTPSVFNTGSDIWDVVNGEWAVQDLACPSGTGVGEWGNITFDEIDVSTYESISLSFDYDINKFDNGDDVKYQVIIDGVAQPEVELINGSSNKSKAGTVTVAIPDGSATVSLILSIVQNGGSDDAQFDNFQLLGTPLPIALTSFTATQKAAQVTLAWATATEINNEYFTVERSSDGIRFEEIGQVDGAGNSTSAQKYELVDAAPMRGMNYYRLSQTDFDGQSETFDIVAINYTGKGTVSIAPTQVQDILTLNVEPTDEVGRVTIFNLVGQKVYDASIEAGVSSQEIDAASFAPGQYLARVGYGSSMETVRFIKL